MSSEAFQGVIPVKGHSNTTQTTCERQTSQTLPMVRKLSDSYTSYGEGALGAPAIRPTYTLEQHSTPRQYGACCPPSEKAGVPCGFGARCVPRRM